MGRQALWVWGQISLLWFLTVGLGARSTLTSCISIISSIKLRWYIVPRVVLKIKMGWVYFCESSSTVLGTWWQVFRKWQLPPPFPTFPWPQPETCLACKGFWDFVLGLNTWVHGIDKQKKRFRKRNCKWITMELWKGVAGLRNDS